MRLLLGTLLPFALQVVGYVMVYVATTGNGSFVGLLAIPAVAVTVPTLLTIGIFGGRSSRSLGSLMLATWSIALLPPAFLLVFNALVT